MPDFLPMRLVRALRATRNDGELIALLTDLFADVELQRVERRLQLYELLLETDSQAEVARQTGISRVTVGRAARVVRVGTGMIATVLARVREERS